MNIWNKTYSILTDKKITRRILLLCIIVMQFRLVNAVVSNVDTWSDINASTATILTTVMAFFTITLKFYFDARD